MTASYQGVDLRSVERSVSDLEWRTVDLESSRDALRARVDDVETGQAALTGRVEDTETELDSIRTSLGRTRRRLIRAQQHLAWLHHHFLSNTRPQYAALDEVDDAVAEYVDRIRAAHQARRQLTATLKKQEEAEQTIRAYEQLMAEHREHATRAAELAHTVNTSRPESAERLAAETAFHDATAGALSTKGRVSSMVDDVNAARRAVEAAVRTEEALRPTIDAGEDASGSLTATLRRRVLDAVAGHQLFPPWLANTLGHTPLEHHREEWVELVTAIVRFRVLNGITDPEAALGGDTTHELAYRIRSFDVGE